MNENIKTSHGRIERDHQQLFDLIEQLASAMRKRKGRTACVDVLTTLLSYTKTHFVMEEALIIHQDSRQTAVHKQQHDRFVSHIHDFTNKLEAGSTVVTLEVNTFLRDWLISHIENTDKTLIAALPATQDENHQARVSSIESEELVSAQLTAHFVDMPENIQYSMRGVIA
jgi:hemerythrin